MGRTCGAVTGAFMVLGLKSANEISDAQEAKEAVYERVRGFSKRFEERNGSSVCRDLLGHDVSPEEGRAKANEEGLFQTLCPEFVRSAAEILEEMLR